MLALVAGADTTTAIVGGRVGGDGVGGEVGPEGMIWIS